ncbi:MAG: FesM [Vicinamibacterales bacterium]
MDPIGDAIRPDTRSMSGVDLLRWPIVGRWLRWRHARTSAQLCLLLVAVVLMLHGIFGPQIAPANLATVLTWVHYRGLLVVALLAAGNLFCTGCPFVLTRDWARRLHIPTWRWPARLRGKWLAVVLFAGVLFAYELFDLWALPRATAYLVLAYFLVAMATDLLFAGASFCKHLCPVGQFNFIASTMSPLEIEIRDEGTCRSCRTLDCISGRRAPDAPAKVVQRGCELGLFLPAKVGNLDCTFCLDCVHACPHDNVALALRTPGLELVDSRRRSGIGRLTTRLDLAVLAMLFVFGALVNAFAMAAPVYRVERWMAEVLRTTSESVVLAALFALGLVVVPMLLVGAAATVSGLLAGTPVQDFRRAAIRYCYALVPLGFSVWVAHYGFHLLTGALVIVPVVQSAVVDLLGFAALGLPLWRWAGLRPGTVFPIQLGVVLLGTLGSLGVLQVMARSDHPARFIRAMLPWAVVIVVLAATVIWVLVQPMEMRGMGFNG